MEVVRVGLRMTMPMPLFPVSVGEVVGAEWKVRWGRWRAVAAWRIHRVRLGLVGPEGRSTHVSWRQITSNELVVQEERRAMRIVKLVRPETLWVAMRRTWGDGAAPKRL